MLYDRQFNSRQILIDYHSLVVIVVAVVFFAILCLFIEYTYAAGHFVWKQTDDMALMWQWQKNEFVYFHCTYLCLRRSVVVIDRKPHASYAEQEDLVSQCVRAAPWSLPLLSLFVYIFFFIFFHLPAHAHKHSLDGYPFIHGSPFSLPLSEYA